MHGHIIICVLTVRLYRTAQSDYKVRADCEVVQILYGLIVTGVVTMKFECTEFV